MQNINPISANRLETNLESGFGVTLIAVTIAVVMGLAVSIYMRQISTQGLQYQDMYTASQARWAALSGVEFGLYKSELGEADVSGSYPFYNSLITIDTLESNTGGGALPDFWYMVTCRGSYGDSYTDMRFFSKKSMKAVWGDVSIIEGTGNVTIDNTVTIDDSLYRSECYRFRRNFGSYSAYPPVYTSNHISFPSIRDQLHLWATSTTMAI